MATSAAAAQRLARCAAAAAPALARAHAAAVARAPGAACLGLDVSVRCSGVALAGARSGLPLLAAVSRLRPHAPAVLAGARLAAAIRAACARPLPASRWVAEAAATTITPAQTPQQVLLSPPVLPLVLETAVEDFPMGFAANASSALTRFALARVNGIAAHEAWRLSRGAPVAFHYPNAMRAFFGLAASGKRRAAASAAAAAAAEAAAAEEELEEAEAKEAAAAAEAAGGAAPQDLPLRQQRRRAPAAGAARENKEAALRLVLALQPALLDEVWALELAGDAEGPLGAELDFGADWLPSASAGAGAPPLLRALSRREAAAARFDVADAALAAMYALANHLTVAAANDCSADSAFAIAAAEALSATRSKGGSGGGGGGGGGGAGTDARAGVGTGAEVSLEALLRLHAAELHREARERLQPPPATAPPGNTPSALLDPLAAAAPATAAAAIAPLPDGARKRAASSASLKVQARARADARAAAAAAVAAAAAAAAPAPAGSALAKAYARARGLFASACREVLVSGSVLPAWGLVGAAKA